VEVEGVGDDGPGELGDHGGDGGVLAGSDVDAGGVKAVVEASGGKVVTRFAAREQPMA
jgi:hypothetical protein